jgi:hypothetical protein
MNETLVSGGIGPNSEYGSYSIGFVSGKLVVQSSLSLKGVLNAAAAKIGGSWATAAATFIEGAIGLE